MRLIVHVYGIHAHHYFDVEDEYDETMPADGCLCTRDYKELI